jgi:hypothetical protein
MTKVKLPIFNGRDKNKYYYMICICNMGHHGISIATTISKGTIKK